MKRSQLALAIAGLLASSASFAVIDATESTITGGPLLFAKGLPSSSTSVVKIPVDGTGTNGDGLDVILPVGFSIPAGATQFIRLDLTGGATFGVELGCMTSVSIVACNKRGVSAIGKSFATFAIKAGTTDISPSSELTVGFSTLSGVTAGPITGAGIRVPNTDNNVTLIYTLHNNDVSADKGVTGEGVLQTATKTVPYVSFVDAISANFTGFKQNDPAGTDGNIAYAAELFSDVGAEFKRFYNVAEPVQLGQVLLTVNTDVFLNTGDADNNSAEKVADDGSNLLGTGSTLVVSGNFSFLQDLTNGEPSGKYDSAASKITFKSGGANLDSRQCDGTDVPMGGTTVAGDKVSFKLDGGGAFVGTSMSLCVSPNGVSVIEGSDISVSFNPVGISDLKLNSATFDKFAKISQNGTVLDSPYLSTNANYVNRLILTNTSGKALKYQVLQVVTDAGKTLPLNTANSTGNIPASANLFLKVEDLITDAAKVSPARVAVRISVTGSNKAVQGVAQTIKKVNVINGGAGDLQTVPFVRKCGGSGCN